jgi:heme A synthase
MVALQFSRQSLGLFAAYLLALAVFFLWHRYLWLQDPLNYQGAKSEFDIFYYTFTTQVGVGYGDILPVSRAAKIAVIFQYTVMLLLIVQVFFCFFCR